MTAFGPVADKFLFGEHFIRICAHAHAWMSQLLEDRKFKHRATRITVQIKLFLQAIAHRDVLP
jgi:hypothetical protein